MPTQPVLIDIVKRRGQRPSEPFQSDKLHASVLAACLSARTPEGEAENTTRRVCSSVILWCSTKPEVTSDDLRRIAAHHLEKLHPDAAYLYKHHRLVI